MTSDDNADTPVRTTVTGEVARITIGPASRGNRVDVEGLQLLRHAFRRCGEEAVSVIVLTGEGADFCAGRDPKPPPDGMSRQDLVELILDTNAALVGVRAITVARVRGRALGLGCGLAVSCDITIASDDAVMGFPEIRHGFAPAIVLSYLDRLVTRKVATDLVLTGREVSGGEAGALGLATRVVPDAELDTEVEAVVEQLRQTSPSALHEAKRLLLSMTELSSHARVARAVESLVGDG